MNLMKKRLTSSENGRDSFHCIGSFVFIAAAFRAEMVVSTFKPDVAAPRVVDEITVELARKHSREASVKLANADFVVEAASRYLGWADKNQHKKVRPEHICLKGPLQWDLARGVCAHSAWISAKNCATHSCSHVQ